MAGDKKVPLPEGHKNFTGIPEAQFVEDVDKYMKETEKNASVESVLRKLDEQHSKYKFMEGSLLARKKKLRSQIPDLRNALAIMEQLKLKKEKSETISSQFLLSEQLYLKADILPTDKVCLWLGANVMLEYTLKDAEDLLKRNLDTATSNLYQIDHDLDFLREQCTTIEVNMARVYNWDVKRRQAAKQPS